MVYVLSFLFLAFFGALLAPSAGHAAPSGPVPDLCIPDDTTLCIDDAPGDGRFRVILEFETELGGGSEGRAGAASLAPLGARAGGILWFFSRKNPEVLVKVLNGCSVNGRYWVFAAAATTVGFSLRVEDTATGEERIYDNLDREPAPTVTDVRAFATCAAPPPPAGRLPSAERLGAFDHAGLAAQKTTRPKGRFVGTCEPDERTLCLETEPGDRRWQVRLRYDTELGGGVEGDAQPLPLRFLGGSGGILWFFNESNPEVLVKVLDGCDINFRYWVFAAAATSVGFELEIVDTVTNVSNVWTNEDRHPATTIATNAAFATCDGSPF